MKKQKAAQDRVRSVVNTWVINYQAYYKANAEALDFTLMNPAAFEALLNRVTEKMGVAISVKAEGEEQIAAIKQELADLKAEIGAIKAAGTVTPANMGALETLKNDPATPAKIYEMLPSVVGGRRITPQTVRNATLRLANIPVGPIDNAESTADIGTCRFSSEGGSRQDSRPSRDRQNARANHSGSRTSESGTGGGSRTSGSYA